MGDSATSNGAVNQDEPSAYQILNQYHSQPSQIKVIGVGAGAAGILLAYKLQKTLKDVSLTIYEKDVGIGGTWIENRYPGVACDVPAHIYTYPFEPNPEWDFFYASGEQIRQYFEGFAKKYGLNRYFQLNSRVKSAVWDEEKGTYNVEVETPNGLLKDWCHVLTNGTGFLNNWKWPDIHGLSSFKGAKAHSANWDPSTKYDGKRVGVIGTGSSAIQIVPQVQKRAKHLTAFMRSETWISPPVGGQLLEELKRTNAAGNQVAAMGQYKYSEAEKEKFRKDPSSLLAHRKQLETSVNSMFEMFIAGSEVSQQVEKMMREEMLRRIGPAREELKAKLIPKWPPGCRRLTPGDGYLEALVQPNVTTVHSEIDRIIPEGVVDSTGKVHELDVLICATGFEIAFAPPFKLIGEAGVSMQNEWNPEPHCYLALAAPKFPNYFVINGPRGNWGSGCVLPTLEVQVDYILKFVQRIQEEGIKSVQVSEQATADFEEHMDVWHKGGVWAAPCKSWYKNNIVDGKPWVWGGSALHYMKTIREPKYEHFMFKYRNKNMFAFLGNGRIEAEAKRQMDRLAPYIRDSDKPWDF